MKRPAHRVIYTGGGGRLGNQVLRFVHWMAWARAHAPDVEVINLAFWPFAHYFAEWRRHPGCVFPVRDGIEDRLASRHGQLRPALRQLFDGRERLARAVQAIGGWLPGWQSIQLNVAEGEELDLKHPAFLEKVCRRKVTTF